MARGRMISSTLGRSKKYNQLPDHFTKLVYIHALTTADEKGRIEADAIAIYGDHFVVDPEASLDRIETALIELDRVHLIELYEAEGKRFAQFADFDKHNTIRRDENDNPTREGRSRIPAPPSHRADTAQSPRSPSTETAPQVEVEVEDKDQGEVERPPSSEERMARAFETGQPQANPAHRVRNELTHLAGRAFAQKYAGELAAWTRWTNEDLRKRWDASDPDLWPGEETKRRTWIFADLLNEERKMPRAVQPDNFKTFEQILSEVRAEA